jgi:Ni,Fe-hydrogenase maturation factor
MGNDAFGRAVYDALPDEVEKIFAHQLLPELLESARRYDRLVFVDAAHGVGDVELCEIYPSNDDTADFHHLGAQTFLKLLQTLYDKTPKAYMCAGYVEEFEIDEMDVGFGDKVSEAVSIIQTLI